MKRENFQPDLRGFHIGLGKSVFGLGHITVRLKYDDTHSHQEFSESDLYPLSACTFRRRPRTAVLWLSLVHFQRVLGHNGCHHI